MRAALTLRSLVGMIALVTALVGTAWAQSKAIHTQKTRDAVIMLKSESGQWSPGANSFVIEFTTPTGQPLDAGKVTLSTSMAMPGMSPMITGATVNPDKTSGRYLASISFPDAGARQVTVSWDGPGGKVSTRFSVPVR